MVVFGELGGEGIEAFGAASGEDEVPAFPGKAFGAGLANAGGSAGDEGSFLHGGKIGIFRARVQSRSGV